MTHEDIQEQKEKLIKAIIFLTRIQNACTIIAIIMAMVITTLIIMKGAPDILHLNQ